MGPFHPSKNCFADSYALSVPLSLLHLISKFFPLENRGFFHSGMVIAFIYAGAGRPSGCNI
jgi:hypothetical protein